MMDSIAFKVTEDDVTAALKLQFKSRLKGRLSAQIILGGIVVGLAAAVSSEAKVLTVKIIAFASGVLLWAAVASAFFTANYLLLRTKGRRNLAQQKALHGEIAAKWSDAGISFSWKRGFADFSWSDFVAVREDQNVILLLQTDSLFNFIPKRALSSDQSAGIMNHARG